ncbi:MAG: penicillin-binding protein 2 [Proteobacteria bacterium]|nr:penicillin-binding protein 2 [Pseudomonadota bacterium]
MTGVEQSRVLLDGAMSRALTIGRHRLMITGALFLFGFFIIAVRLVDLMVIGDGFEPRFAGVADPARHTRLVRHDIIDRNGMLLATNLPTASVYADPKRMLNIDDAVSKLSAVLPGVGRAELAAKLKSQQRFVWIKRNLTPRQQAAVNRLGLPGVAFQREARRVYPQGRLFSHVIGSVDIDSRGIAGVEQAFDDSLSIGREGPGETLRLSLDTRFQHVLRQELALGMARFRAAGAAGVILDANNGEVLAMVSLPDFDPNDPRDRTGAARFNQVTLGVYEMGSTFKIFTAAMALDSGVVALSGGYDASAPIPMGRFLIRDYKPKKRWLSVPEIFVYSSNIGAAKMAADVGAERQRAYLERFGLMHASDIELPEVATPLAPQRWGELSTMTIGYGHGIAVSLLQVASATAAVVNGGIFYSPTLLSRDGMGWVIGRRVISARTSQQMRLMMRLNVAEGTGKKADIRGYQIGGKTGSADKAGKGGYRRRALLSSFVAAFPMSAPRYVVVVMFDEPQGTAETSNFATAGWNAAPTTGRIIARIGPMAGIAVSDDDDREARGLLIKIADRAATKGKEPGVAF